MDAEKQIDHLDELPGNTALYIRETPYLLSELGLGDLPMCMTVEHAKAIMAARDDGDQHTHGVSKDVMHRLPELMSSPVMVLKSNSKYGSIVVVTSEVDDRGDPIIVAVKPNGTAQVGGVKGPANFITSVYPKTNFAVRPGKDSRFNYMYLVTRGDRRQVLYWNKSRTEKLFRDNGFRLPKAFTNGLIKPDEIIKPFRGYVEGGTPQRMFQVADGPFTFSNWVNAFHYTNSDNDLPLWLTDYEPGAEVMELGYTDQDGWHTVASYPTTKKGLERFNQEAPALMREYSKEENEDGDQLGADSAVQREGSQDDPRGAESTLREMGERQSQGDLLREPARDGARKVNTDPNGAMDAGKIHTYKKAPTKLQVCGNSNAPLEGAMWGISAQQYCTLKVQAVP